MIPEEVYKRRHYGTPESFFLTILNIVVVAISIQFFADCERISNTFWIIVGLLAIYNIYSIRKNLPNYTKAQLIGYAIGVVTLVLMIFLFRMHPEPC